MRWTEGVQLGASQEWMGGPILVALLQIATQPCPTNSPDPYWGLTLRIWMSRNISARKRNNFCHQQHPSWEQKSFEYQSCHSKSVLLRSCKKLSDKLGSCLALLLIKHSLKSLLSLCWPNGQMARLQKRGDNQSQRVICSSDLIKTRHHIIHTPLQWRTKYNQVLTLSFKFII